MECNAQRSAVDAGAKEIPCPTRRRILGGLATLAATTSFSKIVAAHDQYHAVVRYLHGEFMEAASRLGHADGKTDDALYRRMLALATALTVIPGSTPGTRQLKEEVAAWSFEDGHHTLLLPTELAAALAPDSRPWAG